MLTGRVVPFCREAIKAEKPNKVKCDADEIDIFSRQDAPLSVPATSLLVTDASVTCQFVFGEFFLV